MNQEQNNFNQNSFNMQGNNGISNNQTLNNFNPSSNTNQNQSLVDNQGLQNNQNINNAFNQGVQQDTNISQPMYNSQPASSFQQTIFNPQTQLTPSYQQSINQTNVQETVQQPINNTFESGNGNNPSFNSKTPKKMNLGLIIGIVAAVAVIGIWVIFGSKLLLNNNKNSGVNNLDGTSQSNSITKDNYKKIELDRIGEFNSNEYFKREQMQPIPVTIGKINFGHGDLYRTLDFTNSDLRPTTIEFNYFNINSKVQMTLYPGEDVSKYSEYQQLDTSEYENIAPGFKLNLFYKSNSTNASYNLIASKDGYHWDLFSSFKENYSYDTEEEAKENLKKMLKLIQSEYDEMAPTSSEFLANLPITIDFSFATLDFNNEKLKVEPWLVHFNGEQDYKISSMEMGLNVYYKEGSLNLGVTYVNNIYNNYSTEEVKKDTKTLYELNINNKNIRAYIIDNDNLAYLGFIANDIEYIIPAKTEGLSVEEVFELLNLIIQ